MNEIDPHMAVAAAKLIVAVIAIAVLALFLPDWPKKKNRGPWGK
jgi:preprotein translocase subunit Sec61beta